MVLWRDVACRKKGQSTMTSAHCLELSARREITSSSVFEVSFGAEFRGRVRNMVRDSFGSCMVSFRPRPARIGLKLRISAAPKLTDLRLRAAAESMRSCLRVCLSLCIPGSAKSRLHMGSVEALTNYHVTQRNRKSALLKTRSLSDSVVNVDTLTIQLWATDIVRRDVLVHGHLLGRARQCAGPSSIHAVNSDVAENNVISTPC